MAYRNIQFFSRKSVVQNLIMIFLISSFQIVDFQFSSIKSSRAHIHVPSRLLTNTNTNTNINTFINTYINTYININTIIKPTYETIMQI